MFAEVEAAWDMILADPALSGAVYEQQTRDLNGQYARAAWCHWSMNDLERAAETLDRGRSRILLRALLGKQEDRLDEGHKAALATARRALEQARLTGSNAEALSEWYQYLSLRRRLGLDGVLQGVTAEQIRANVPRGGAIVQLMILPGHASAIIALGGRSELLGVPLPAHTASMIDEVVQGADNLPGWRSAYESYLRRRSRKHVRHWRNTVQRALQMAGACVAQPIHEALLHAGVEPGAAVILSLPGQLGPLPISCAPLPDGRSFNEAWHVSLVPSLSSLSTEPVQSCDGTTHRALVIACCEDPSNRAPLPFARRESDLIAGRFASERRVLLSEQEASLPNVLQRITTATVMHTCCHSAFDWREPGNSGLQLSAGGRLTINTLLGISPRWRTMRLAFLSSCESGIAGASSVPDEFLGIHCAFLQAGARVAIGSLWAVHDDTAMVFADRFYRYYLDETGGEAMSPVAALSKAQHWLRTVTVKELLDEKLFSVLELAELLHRRTRLSRQLRSTLDLEHRIPPREPRRAHGPARSGTDMLSARPYAAPMEWAGFVSIGV